MILWFPHNFVRKAQTFLSLTTQDIRTQPWGTNVLPSQQMGALRLGGPIMQLETL